MKSLWGGQKIYNSVLTNASLGYRNKDFIGRKFVTTLDLTNTMDLDIPIYDTSELEYRDHTRVPGSNFDKITQIVDFKTLSTKWHSLAGTIPEEITRQYRDNVPINIRNKIRENVDSNLELELEYMISQYAQTVGNYAAGHTFSPVTKWDNLLASTPVEDIQSMMDIMEDDCGMKPNIMVVSQDVWRILRTHPEITAYMGENNQVKVGNFEVMRMIFVDSESKEYPLDIVLGASFRQEPSTGAFTKLWTKSVALAYTVKGTLEYPEPTFLFLGITDNKEVYEYFTGDNNSNSINVQWKYGLQGGFNKAGALLYDVLT